MADWTFGFVGASADAAQDLRMRFRSDPKPPGNGSHQTRAAAFRKMTGQERLDRLRIGRRPGDIDQGLVTQHEVGRFVCANRFGFAPLP